MIYKVIGDLGEGPYIKKIEFWKPFPFFSFLSGLSEDLACKSLSKSHNNWLIIENCLSILVASQKQLGSSDLLNWLLIWGV